jgi:peptide/nickel transport system substrate-binding protein
VAAKPQPGGTAVVALSSEPDALNPLISTSSNAGLIIAEMHDGLTEMDDDLDYVPRIATSWDLSPDGLEITYHLQPWVWSDGTALTARDVVTSFDLFKDERIASPRSGSYKDVSGAFAPDSATVRYVFSRPLPDPLRRTWHHILPAHLTENLDPTKVRSWELNRAPLSSGEFVLEEWVHNRSLVLVRNRLYPGKSAYLDRVVFRVLPEEGARTVALETGEVDLVSGLTPDTAARLKDNPEIRIEAIGGRRFYYLQWNFVNPIFADATTRLALSHSLDRSRMINTLLLGYGQPGVGPIPPAVWNFHPALTPDAFDPVKARDMLAQAGWEDQDGDGVLERDGREFRFEILTRQGDPIRENGAVIIRENLRAVGVAVELRVLELATGLEMLRAGKFDAYFGLLNANLFGDPSSYVHSAAVGEFNNGRYANARIDSLLELAGGAPDRQAALPLWHQVQEVLAEDPPAAYLLYPETLVGYNRRLRDVEPHILSPINNLADWWIAPGERKYKTE